MNAELNRKAGKAVASLKRIGMIALIEAIPHLHQDLYRNDEWVIVDETKDYFYAVRVGGVVRVKDVQAFPKSGPGCKWQIVRLSVDNVKTTRLIKELRKFGRTRKADRGNFQADYYTDKLKTADKVEEAVRALSMQEAELDDLAFELGNQLLHDVMCEVLNSRGR